MNKKLAFVMAGLSLAALVSCTGSNKEFNYDSAISVICREDGSGTKSAFMEIIGLKSQKGDVKGAIIQNSTAAVLQGVAQNPYSIAYDSLGYVTDDVKKLQVNKVDCTLENCKTGAYAISRPLSVVYKEDTIKASSVFSAYLQYLTSSQAQTIISSNGYVQIVDNASTYSAISGLEGTINISGSTSLQPLMNLLAADFEKLQPKVTVNVSGGGSGTGLSDAENGTSNFGMISKEFVQTDAPSCTHYTVAKDGIAVIANKSNPVTSVTMDQLKSIYGNGEGEHITTWASLKA